MKTTFEIRSLFDKLIQELPEKTRQELSVRYNYSSILHGTIDVIIERGNQCMALGRFRTVSEESPSDFCERFRQAMGYPDDTWYLFDYDGKNMVINDLSLSEPVDEFPATLEEGLRRLITTPDEWHADQKKFQEMKQFLEAVRHLIDEESLNNSVN
jgi:maltodextrin utilization protein YvdJ